MSVYMVLEARDNGDSNLAVDVLRIVRINVMCGSNEGVSVLVLKLVCRSHVSRALSGLDCPSVTFHSFRFSGSCSSGTNEPDQTSPPQLQTIAEQNLEQDWRWCLDVSSNGLTISVETIDDNAPFSTLPAIHIDRSPT